LPNNIELISGSESNGVTILEFDRLLVTNDTVNDQPIVLGNASDMIYALNNLNDPIYTSSGLIADKHTTNGVVYIDFGQPSTCGGSSGDGFYENPDGTYSSTWSINGDTIFYTITAQTTGWVGLGLSPTGNMPNSDIIVGWVDDNTNAVVVLDRFAYDTVMPVLDKEQNILQPITGQQN